MRAVSKDGAIDHEEVAGLPTDFATKVAQAALRDAAAPIAGLMITTGCVIPDKLEEGKKMSPRAS